jgi:hypothetical protein
MRALSLLALACLACARPPQVPKPRQAAVSNTAPSTSSYRAARPGILPKEPAPTVAGIKLPAGRLVVPSPDFASGPALSTPVLWMTLEPVDDVGSLWSKLAAEFHATGLWPLVLVSLEGDERRPWVEGELGPDPASQPGQHDAASVLATWWREVLPVEGEEEVLAQLAPFGKEFPGLAPASNSKRDPLAAARVADALEGRLGLVAVSRPADALAAIGWLGPTNYYSNMGMLSAVLRSWEERFGAHLVGVGFDIIALGVERPPQGVQASTRVAAEHFAACPDAIYQGPGSIEKYASAIADQNTWGFWWD